MTAWTFDHVPDQSGRTAIVTGANTGIGLETARMLALRGADVTLACRSVEKGQAAVDRILAERPRGRVEVAALDLSDLRSVESFASRFQESHERLDLLIANAGVMVPPLGRTTQGFELQFGTNHLGHFALTARLLPLVQRTQGSRVVVVSSSAANFGRIDFDDPNWEKRRYSAVAAYCQSKLANSISALELDRRLRASDSHVRVTAAHPGWTATDLQRTAAFTRLMSPILGMKAADGAMPTMRAATDPDAASGSYYGPAGLFELGGPPVVVKVPARARDVAVAAELWSVSERLTNVSFDLPAATTLRAAS